ncbi:IS3 transposase (plasmid) [Escherichia sp. HH091_1A]|uniref:Transposase n=1 Tax=Escherichia coli TaxID=562 RepID=A0A0L1ASC1_ECOLX|nr:hypothetical protein WR15_23495 [Escherichia coli]BDI44385.1 IS3 transposase [Escherichia sp. HH091_1A]
MAESLRRQGLRAKASRKFSPISYRAHGLPVSENLLEQDFYASGPNQKWAGDITYLGVPRPFPPKVPPFELNCILIIVLV